MQSYLSTAQLISQGMAMLCEFLGRCLGKCFLDKGKYGGSVADIDSPNQSIRYWGIGFSRGSPSAMVSITCVNKGPGVKEEPDEPGMWKSHSI